MRENADYMFSDNAILTLFYENRLIKENVNIFYTYNSSKQNSFTKLIDILPNLKY